MGEAPGTAKLASLRDLARAWSEIKHALLPLRGAANSKGFAHAADPISGVAYVVHRELYIRPPIKIWLVQYPKSCIAQLFHYPQNKKYIYSSDSLPQEWISQSFSLTCPTKVNFPENGSVGRPNGLENTPRGCTIHSEEVWARGEPWRPIS